MLSEASCIAFRSQLHCFQSPTALLSGANCIAFALRKHYSRSCAALLPKLCNIAAQVVPACCTFSGTVFLQSIKTAIRNQFNARDDTKLLFLSPELFSFENKKKKRVSLHFAHLFVTLASPNLLSFENEKEKRVFFLHFAHLFVTLPRFFGEVTPSRQKKKQVSLFCTQLLVTLHPGSDNKQITR